MIPPCTRVLLRVRETKQIIFLRPSLAKLADGKISMLKNYIALLADMMVSCSSRLTYERKNVTESMTMVDLKYRPTLVLSFAQEAMQVNIFIPVEYNIL